MAQPVQGIQNKWLLIIAVVLALVVVVLYNAHIRAIRSEQEGRTLAVVQMAKDLPAGEKITAKHITRAEIPRDSADAYKKVWKWKDREILTGYGGKVIHRTLNKGEYLLYDYVDDVGGSRASRKLADGMVGIGIEFDRDQSLGDLLAPGDTVNLKGVFPTPGGIQKTYRIVSDVRVMNVGGVGATEDASRARRARNYQRITIEVTPDVSLKLSNLLTHMIGEVQVELNPAGISATAQPGQINPQLDYLASQAKSASRTGRTVRVPQRATPAGR